MQSLWGDDFTITVPDSKISAKKLAQKINNPKQPAIITEKVIKSKKLSLSERLKLIQTEVKRILYKQLGHVKVIYDKDELHEYILKGIHANSIAVDTETNNSLDPINCKIMGLCLYVPGEKQAYIPINHIDPTTGELLSNQLTEHDLNEELTYLNNSSARIIMHNGKFDYQVIKCTCGGIEMRIDWDTLIAAKLLDENEKSAGLKEQYISKIDPEQEKYSIDHLFDKVAYAEVPPELFAYYAATDSYMTYKLYEWQFDKFICSSDLNKVYKLFNDIEMPLVKVIAEMELAGMEVDQEYCKLLSAKYHKKLDDLDIMIMHELDTLAPQINAWRLTDEATKKPHKKTGEGFAKSKSEQLETPINLASPTQLAILFYDVLKCPQVSKKSPRGTGEDELAAIAQKLNLKICDLLIKRKELVKLLTTYIDVIPKLSERWADHRVRTNFNQYGAATGRLSSSGNINYQNIPSHNKEIRLCFKSADGYKIIGSDYSGQEVRLTAFYAQDPAMIKAYNENKDLYPIIASMCFNKSYEECLEHHADGSIYEEGQARRSAAKTVLLGLLYGRGSASIAQQIGKSKEEAQSIIDKFFKAFPSVHKWINDTIDDAHKVGYVEDLVGRRRRLPDILLPKYEVKFINQQAQKSQFNPFLQCQDRVDDVLHNLLNTYIRKCDQIKYASDYEKIKQEALNNGIEIHSNTGFIAQAERQAVNSRVQGGAATLTKAALIDIYNNKRMKEIGAKIINAIHDEILIEAPDEYAEEAAQLLTSIMTNTAKRFVTNVPMSCDPTIEPCWYLTEFFAVVKKEFKAMIDRTDNPLDAFETLCENRTESTRDQLYEIVKEFLPQIPNNVKIIKTL